MHKCSHWSVISFFFSNQFHQETGLLFKWLPTINVARYILMLLHKIMSHMYIIQKLIIIMFIFLTPIQIELPIEIYCIANSL